MSNTKENRRNTHKRIPKQHQGDRTGAEELERRLNQHNADVRPQARARRINDDGVKYAIVEAGITPRDEIDFTNLQSSDNYRTKIKGRTMKGTIGRVVGNIINPLRKQREKQMKTKRR